METRRSNNGYLVAGLLLILLGGVFLVATFGVAGLNWDTIWPVFIMLVGLGPLVTAFTEHQDDPRRRALPVMISSFLLMLGVFFFATTLEYFSWSDQGKLWPVYIIIIGIAALAGYLASGLNRFEYLATGIVLSLVGGGFLAATLFGALDNIHWAWFDNISTWFEGSWAATWWPIFPIAVGLILLAASAMTHNLSVRGSLAFLGTIPLLVGVFFLATTLEYISADDQGRLWPVYPLIVGVASLAAYFASKGEQRSYLFSAGLFGAVGVVFLPVNLISEDMAGQVWPLFLIIGGGLLLLFQRPRHLTR